MNLALPEQRRIGKIAAFYVFKVRHCRGVVAAFIVKEPFFKPCSQGMGGQLFDIIKHPPRVVEVALFLKGAKEDKGPVIAVGVARKTLHHIFIIDILLDVAGDHRRKEVELVATIGEAVPKRLRPFFLPCTTITSGEHDLHLATG